MSDRAETPRSDPERVWLIQVAHVAEYRVEAKTEDEAIRLARDEAQELPDPEWLRNEVVLVKTEATG